MKIRTQFIATLVVFFTLIGNAKAQYVTIPDPGMVTWLTANYPSAMNGNQMDTTDYSVVNEDAIILNFSFISNLDGIQYFDNLYTLYCAGNSLTTLPPLPNSLQNLHCYSNFLTSLPLLPNSLQNLQCHNNFLTSLPQLPESLQLLVCGFNNLTTLPQLPDSLHELGCSNNPNLSCLPMLPNTLEILFCSNTSITCLPNYPTNIVFESALPNCQPNYPNGCETTEYISGTFFDNSNNSCINNANLSTNATIKLYDDQNNFLQSRSASSDDHYYFSIEPGNYVVRVDSSFFTNGVNLSCPVSGEHNVTAIIDSSYIDRDFGLNCAGIDLGVEAILPQGIVFPGQPHSLKAIAGDLSNYFGLNCAAGTGGTVEITVTGPITYVDYPSTALAPVVNGNTFTYSISDFSNVNLQEAFVLNFLTNTTAQATNLISVTAQITSNATDLDLSNNATSFSYFVVNSYDPNMKEANPVNVLPGYDDYFTYTVHFQNMGNAPAFNIKIKDTLDQNLDFETFRVINASHPYSYNLTCDLLNVYFPNIMLADSASDPEGSKGFVQYQVKPKANLPLGTTIENTAHIYFDFNPAVVTNTTTNEFVQTLGFSDDAFGQWSIAPNPNNGTFSVQLKHAPTEQLNVFVLDSQGRKVVQETIPAFSKTCTLQTTLAPGVYFLQLSSGNNNSEMKRVVVE